MNSNLKELWPKQKIDITSPRCARENKNEVHGFMILMSLRTVNDIMISKPRASSLSDLLPLVGVGEVTHYMLAIQ